MKLLLPTISLCLCSENDAGAIRLLVEHGANVSVRTILPTLGPRRLCSSSTPLHIAAIFCCPDAVTALMELGADAELRNVNDETPLLSGRTGWIRLDILGFLEWCRGAIACAAVPNGMTILAMLGIFLQPPAPCASTALPPPSPCFPLYSPLPPPTAMLPPALPLLPTVQPPSPAHCHAAPCCPLYSPLCNPLPPPTAMLPTAAHCAAHCHVDTLNAFASKGANVHAKVMSGDNSGCVSALLYAPSSCWYSVIY